MQIFEINLNHQRGPLLMINLVLLMNFSLAEYVMTLPKSERHNVLSAVSNGE